MSPAKLKTRSDYFENLLPNHSDKIAENLNKDSMNFGGYLKDSLNDIPLLSNEDVIKVITEWNSKKETIAFAIKLQTTDEMIGYLAYEYGWDDHICSYK